MKRIYKAHINRKTGEIQTVKEHDGNVATLGSQFSITMSVCFMMWENISWIFNSALMEKILKLNILFAEPLWQKNCILMQWDI